MAKADRLIQLFNEAKGRSAGAERDAYVANACSEGPELEAQLVSLLQAHEQAGEFLQKALMPPAIPVLEKPGDRVGRYRLLHQIGEGGCGVVYMAEQEHPVRRRVALKVIKLGMDTKQVVARFEAERQALALMDHPNIAKVLDAGVTDAGRPFFVMELVRGIKITDYCDQHHLSTRERIELFIRVCQAIQHAHQKGIIHRDIKPSNIVVTQHDNLAVPKVIDFGIAKATTDQQLTDKTVFTAFEQFIGTPAYMSPEQAQFSGLDIDTRTDTYSLGVLLYELLTGKTPLDAQELLAAGIDEMRRTIREQEPARPSARLSTMSRRELTTAARLRGLDPPKLIHLLRGDLDWIVMKCLEKDRTRRYETVNGLALDLKRHLNSEPVVARPPSAAYRFRKLVHRNKVIFAAASVVFLVLLSGVLVSARQAVRATRAEREAKLGQENTSKALAAETLARSELEGALRREQREAYFHHITLAHRELAENNLAKAEALLDECVPREGQPDHRSWEWHYLKRLCLVDPVVVRGQPDWPQAAALSPDGRRLACLGAAKSVKLCEATTGRELLTIPDAGEVSCVAFLNPDGSWLVTGNRNGLITLWDINTRQRLAVRGQHTATVRALACGDDGRLFASAGDDNTVNVWDASSGVLLHSLRGHERPVLTVAFSPGGKLLASAGYDTTVQIWAPTTGKLIHTIRKHRDPVSSIAFSPDGRYLALGSFDRAAKVCDVATGQLVLPPLAGHLLQVYGVTFVDGGRRLASVSADRTMRIWDVATGQEVLVLRGYTHELSGLVSSSDGRRIAAVSGDGTAKIWDATPVELAKGQETLVLSGHTDQITGLAFNRDGSRFVTSGWDATARVWDSNTGRELLTFTNHPRIVFDVAFSPNGRLIASGSAQLLQDEPSYLKIWDVITGHEVLGTQGNSVDAFAVTFSPGDGRWIATGNVWGEVTLWDAVAGQRRCTLSGPEGWLTCLSFSPDGRRLASLIRDGLVSLYDTMDSEEWNSQGPLLTFRAHNRSVYGNLAFSPDGHRLLVPGDENTVNVFDLPPQGHADVPVRRVSLRGHTAQVRGVAFSPDGRFIASGGEDNTVRLWDAAGGGEPLHTFRGHSGWVSRVAFSPDGKRLVSASFDKTMRIWDTARLARP